MYCLVRLYNNTLLEAVTLHAIEILVGIKELKCHKLYYLALSIFGIFHGVCCGVHFWLPHKNLISLPLLLFEIYL